MRQWSSFCFTCGYKPCTAAYKAVFFHEIFLQTSPTLLFYLFFLFFWWSGVGVCHILFFKNVLVSTLLYYPIQRYILMHISTPWLQAVPVVERISLCPFFCFLSLYCFEEICQKLIQFELEPCRYTEWPDIVYICFRISFLVYSCCLFGKSIHGFAILDCSTGCLQAFSQYF